MSVYAFLYLPLIVLGVFSFNASRIATWTGFTWQWYGEVFGDGLLWEGTRNSLVIGITTTAISTVLGTLAGYSLWKTKAPVLTNSLYLSLVTPEVLAGVSLLLLFQLLFRVVHLRLGMHTVILAHVSFSLVYVVLVVLSRLRYFDRDLEDAALDLGATPWDAFWRVTVPLLRPGIIAAALLCFTVSFDDYVITSLVAGIDSQTLPMLIYAMARKGVSPAVNALSVLITVVFGGFILAADKLEQRSAQKLSAERNSTR
ncbi:MAG: ABC transporter permease [Bryobacteraceae bacterium]